MHWAQHWAEVCTVRIVATAVVMDMEEGMETVISEAAAMAMEVAITDTPFLAEAMEVVAVLVMVVVAMLVVAMVEEVMLVEVMVAAVMVVAVVTDADKYV